MKRTVSLFLFAAILFSSLYAFMPGIYVKAENETALYPDSGKTAKVTVTKGDTFQVQFNTGDSFTEVNVLISTSGSGKMCEISLYKWDTNVKKSAQSEPVCRKTVSDWESGSYLGISASDAGVSSFPQGEYVLDIKTPADQTGKVTVNAVSSAKTGVAVYCNYLLQNKYSVNGTVTLTGESGEGLKEVSKNTDYEYNRAAPDYVFTDDTNVVKMGVDPSQWVCVDGLGRTVPGNDVTGDKKDKTVGIFYWTWHQGNMQSKAVNVNNLTLEYPDSINNYKHKIWSQNNVGSYFWDEPIFGYYTALDDYVLRKHAELLADAGVDFVVFDCTNVDLTWEESYLNLLKVWAQAREEGVKTPKIAFMLNFGWDKTNTLSSLKQIYKAIYQKGLYQDQWFYWEGKPLVVGYDTGLDKKDMLQAEIKQFFTFRYNQPSYFGGDMDDSAWGWLHVYPQACYYNSDGTVEMTTVGVCMNADYSTMSLSAQNGAHNMGRSFTMQKDFSYSYEYRGRTVKVDSSIENSMFYGLNFQEQWDYAISKDPEIIFVTGWNEWIMGRFEEWCGVKNAFPDQFNDENSRDAEPSKGVLKDYYYTQLVSNIRRYKGTNPIAVQNISKTIDINGGAEQWNDEGIVTFSHYLKNTYKRNKKTWGITYTGDEIRNDIKSAKVSYDDSNIYFYVETADDITPYTDANWMRLLIDTGAATENSTDWEEFEYILNRNSPSATEMTLEKSTGGWNFETVANVRYNLSGKILQVEIPRSCLGLQDTDTPQFNFKWCDNNLTDGDIMTVYTDGDAAPGSRFAFAFRSVAAGNTDKDDSRSTDSGDNSNYNSESGKSGGNTRTVMIAAIAAAVVALGVTLTVVLKPSKKK